MIEYLIFIVLIWIGAELNDIGSLLRRRFIADMELELDRDKNEILSFKPKRLRK